MGNSQYYIYKQLIASIPVWTCAIWLRREGTRSCSRNWVWNGVLVTTIDKLTSEETPTSLSMEDLWLMSGIS
ncbi:hypothetical protein C5167_041825 [Papaver somniferum]|nr:hypothetical protein C5167_041825 [Papaver somniferum]